MNVTQKETLTAFLTQDESLKTGTLCQLKATNVFNLVLFLNQSSRPHLKMVWVPLAQRGSRVMTDRHKRDVSGTGVSTKEGSTGSLTVDQQPRRVDTPFERLLL